jgi:steroid delta-isomerase-like uncharacterized protein
MTDDAQIALIARAVEAVNRSDLAAVDRLFSPDFVDPNPARAGLSPGPEGIRLVWGLLRAAFPDLAVQVEDLLVDGDKVVIRARAEGTHEGAFMGMPATGKQVAIGVIDINRIEDGRLAERWAVADLLGMLQQLGALPAPGTPS